jgi:xylulokinase
VADGCQHRETQLARETLIGIDVGTTALKAVLLDAAGNRLADFARPVAMSRPGPGLAEQDAEDWIGGVLAALAAFGDGHDLGGLRGIGIASQVNTHVFVGDGGRALLPAITWQDTRCALDAAALDAQVATAQKEAWFGAPIPIDASHALSRMAHVARVHPDQWAKTRHVLLPKDFCVMRLTGEVAGDPVAAVGLVGRDGYVGELLELVPHAARRLPPLHRFSHVAGRVRAGLPCAGTPVVVGAMDAWAGMFGVGVIANGDAMYQSGTSEILGVISDRVQPTPGVIVFPPYEGIVLHAAPTQSGGAALGWFANVLGRSPSEVAALAGTIEPSDAVPLFLPHLQGERAPLWDAASRGIFARLDARAGAPEMARSVMEGVAFSARLAFDALAASSGAAVPFARLGGGGTRSDLWCQMRADVLGFPLSRSAIPDAAALGACILAGLGSGTIDTLAGAVGQLVKYDRTFEPQAPRRAYYDDRFAHYRALYEQLRPFNARF